MGITRRRFMKLSVAAILLAAFSLYVHMETAKYRLFRKYRPKAPEGDRIDDATLETLLLASVALTGLPIEENHYALYFKWRAEHLYGYADIYRRVAVRIWKKALSMNGKPFPECTGDERVRIVRAVRKYKRGSRLRYNISSAIRGDLYLFEKRFFTPVLKLFSSTDALIHLGYRKWPGKPRGLRRYQFHP